MLGQMNRIKYVLLSCIVFLAACQTDPQEGHTPLPVSEGIVFRLHCETFDNATARSAVSTRTDYSKVAVCVIDDAGFAVDGVKGLYDPDNSAIRLEGLREGDFRLLLLGIRGDETADGATIHTLRSIDDEWLTFPSNLNRPLEAEYFYSQTPFSVIRTTGDNGDRLTAVTDDEIMQRRIIGRADFTLNFHNDYVKTAMLTNRVTIQAPRFRTGLTGDGTLTGQSDGTDFTLDLHEATSYLFLPTVESEPLHGQIEMTSRNYRGTTIRRTYAFALPEIAPNRIGTIDTQVIHPDDQSAVAFVTEEAMDAIGIVFILQDDEPHTVYTDRAQRSFNTAAPLQVSVTDEGKLHVRFYSPRELNGVLIQSRIPAAGNEFFDIAYFDRVPAFADFYCELPIALRTVFGRTESGSIIEAGPLTAAELQEAEFRIQSDDPFWAKLCAIRHGWNISFALYGGNPELPDGGPVGNWMGIRPVHCREAVALFLNFTYMIDMPEHEEILHANVDNLYGNGGVNDKVTVEVVLKQMRQTRTLNVGLVYPSNGVVGLGGGSVFGAYQQAWFQHYFNSYSCEIMFHELGHVMGYNHSSSFTYGPWAQELMNNFYVQHISEMPIDSPSYLNSSQNPNKY